MARRPEDPKRNRRSAGPLDWLAEEQPTPAVDDESAPPGAWPPPRRPSPYAAAPVDETPPARRPGAAMPSRRELRQQAADRTDPPRGFTEPPMPPAPPPTLRNRELPLPHERPWPGSDSPWEATPPDSRGRAWGATEAASRPAAGPPAPLPPALPSTELPPPGPRRREAAPGEGAAGSESAPSPRSRSRERARDPEVSPARAEAPVRRRDARRSSGEGAEERPARTPRRRRVATYLTLAALLLALWAASCFFDAGPLAGLTSVAPLVSVLAIPVIAVGVGSKHPVPTAIAAVAALVPWTLVPGYAATGPGRVDVGSDNTLRVMSINGAAGRADPGNIVSLVRSYQVDVVVVTELTSGLAHDLTVAGLGNLAASRWVSIPPGGADGTGLWSRLPVRDLRALPGLSGASVQGNLVTGRDLVRLTAVQLGGEALRPGAGWRGDLQELATPPGATRAMIVGDLNASPWQPAFRRVTGAGWRDAADVVGQGLRPTWPSWSAVPIAPLDHVLVSKGLGVNAADTANVGGTDHRALIVTLVVPGGGD